MARLQKDVVSYFPHDANACAGDTMTVLQGRFGNDGYAFWFKLLEKLASTDGHCVDCRSSTKWQLFLAKMGVNELTGVEIMNLLVEMQAIDKDLWDSKLIWCQNLVDNLEAVYSSRHRELPRRPVTTEINGITTERNCIICGKNIVDMRADAKFCSNACRQKAYRVTAICNAETAQKGITTEVNGITTEVNGITTGDNTQSKVKQSKVNKSTKKELEKRFATFWTAYPKKVSKGQAERAFFSIQPDDELLEVMLEAIKLAKRSEAWLKEGGRYIKNPATWLNAKCWDDEIQKEGGYHGGPIGSSGTHQQASASKDRKTTDQQRRASLL